MITLNLGSDNTLTCASEWDSATHLGFGLSIQESGSYSYKTLDKVLSKDQIKALEILLVTTAKQFIRGEK